MSTPPLFFSSFLFHQTNILPETGSALTAAARIIRDANGAVIHRRHIGTPPDEALEKGWRPDLVTSPVAGGDYR